MKRRVGTKQRVLLVWMTAPNRVVGKRIAKLLVEGKLAACVNLLPGIRSLYVWKGRVEEAGEVLLLAKTTAARYGALEAAVRSHHPYEVCEVVAMPVTRGSAPYLDWVVESLAEKR